MKIKIIKELTGQPVAKENIILDQFSCRNISKMT